VVEHRPPAGAVLAAGQEHLERVVPGGPGAPGPAAAQAGVEFGHPLAVGGAAQPEPVGEQPGPVLPGAEVAAGREPLAPEVFGPLLAVPVVGVPPQPGGQHLVLVGVGGAARDPLVDGVLGGEQPGERGAGEFPGVPRVVGGDLRVADAGRGEGGEEGGQGGRQ
jgi:hypothetical protein